MQPTDASTLAFRDQLNNSPEVQSDIVIVCPICGMGHRLEKSFVLKVDGEGSPVQEKVLSDAYLFYRCSGASYLGAVYGRLVDNVTLPKGKVVVI